MKFVARGRKSRQMPGKGNSFAENIVHTWARTNYPLTRQITQWRIRRGSIMNHPGQVAFPPVASNHACTLCACYNLSI